MNFSKSIALIAALSMIVLAGCGKQKPPADEHDGHDHAKSEASHHEPHDEPRQFTLFQDSLELFGEWNEWEQDQKNRMVIHLTNLRDYAPIREGTVVVEWLANDQSIKQSPAVEAARTGIFIVTFSAPTAGSYDLRFTLNSKQAAGTVLLEKQVVYRDHAVVPHPEAVENPGEISFLKEQQWQIPFDTELVERRTLYHTIRAVGEIKPVGEAEADVYAPFDGVLLPSIERGAFHPGDRVKEGEMLAILTASAGALGGWSDLVRRYKLSKADYERAVELRKQGGISEREFQEDSLLYKTESVRLKSVAGGQPLDDRLLEDGHFNLRAPKSGVLSHVHLRFGQYVSTGERLISIVNPAQVSLEAHVAVGDADELREVHGAYFTVAGQEKVYSLADFHGKLSTISALIDPESMRIPVIFELDNSKHILKPGSFARVTIQSAKAGDRVAIPESALLEEDGLPVVIIQQSGESYEKRNLRTGIRDQGFVEVLHGVEVGERIVTTGAYKVKLAAVKTGDVGHGHAH